MRSARRPWTVRNAPRLPDEPAVRRLLVSGLAGVVLTAPLSAQQWLGPHPALAAAVSGAGAVLALSCCRTSWVPSRRATAAAAFVCLVFAAATLTMGAGQVVTALQTADRTLVCQDDVAASVAGGAAAVREGVNLYASFDIPAAERALGCGFYRVTPLRTGQFAHLSQAPSDASLQPLAGAVATGRQSGALVTAFTYPAGTALAGAAGPHGLVVITALALVLAGAALVLTSARAVRPWLALALLAQAGSLVLVGPVRPDGIVAALLVLACARRQPLLDGLALGLACAIKQTAWILTPPLLILGLRRDRRAGLRQAAAAATVFVLLNAPFAAPAPLSWLRDVLVPETAPLFPSGGGLWALLAPAAGSPVALAAALSALALATLVAGCVLAWRGRDGWSAAGVLVASLALWDGPRSLLFYLGVLGLVTVAVCAGAASGRPVGAPLALDRAQLSAG